MHGNGLLRRRIRGIAGEVFLRVTPKKDLNEAADFLLSRGGPRGVCIDRNAPLDSRLKSYHRPVKIRFMRLRAPLAYVPVALAASGAWRAAAQAAKVLPVLQE